jgi:hypothetical protein
MAAIIRMMLAIDQIPAPAVGVLPTSGSWGQLLVYERPVSPGRSVAADHADQKMNAGSACSVERILQRAGVHRVLLRAARPARLAAEQADVVRA